MITCPLGRARSRETFNTLPIAQADISVLIPLQHCFDLCVILIVFHIHMFYLLKDYTCAGLNFCFEGLCVINI